MGTVTRVREVRAQLPAEALPYGIGGMHVRVNPRFLGYGIPFLAGLAIMVGGMKTAAVPLVSIPQLVLGVALVAFTSWEFLSDSGLLDLRPAAPIAPPPLALEAAPSARGRKTYDEGFRRHAVDIAVSSGQPIAAVARELDVNPGTLRRWIRKDREQRAAARAASLVGSDGGRVGRDATA